MPAKYKPIDEIENEAGRETSAQARRRLIDDLAVLIVRRHRRIQHVGVVPPEAKEEFPTSKARKRKAKE